jgi:hypothetical protein
MVDVLTRKLLVSAPSLQEVIQLAPLRTPMRQRTPSSPRSSHRRLLGARVDHCALAVALAMVDVLTRKLPVSAPSLQEVIQLAPLRTPIRQRTPSSPRSSHRTHSATHTHLMQAGHVEQATAGKKG